MSSVALRHLPAALCVEEDGEDLRKAQQAIYLLYLLSEKKAGALVTPAAHFRQFPIEKNCHLTCHCFNSATFEESFQTEKSHHPETRSLDSVSL